MEAHLARLAAIAAAVVSLGASYRTPNFIVEAPSEPIAQQIGKAAEAFRRDLATDWLGKPMPNWAQPCPITAQVGDHLGAGGATSFVFEHGEVFGWRMTIQGSLVRILDSVLPHEVTHTVFATHFRRPLPRWADEGACTTVEHPSEKSKQQMMLIDFLHTDRGIAFNRMFAMKEYPRDVMPLYSQGYSVARYLVAQGGKRKFLAFLADGMADENWSRATRKFYGIPNLDHLQNQWLAWVRKGSPDIQAPPEASLVSVEGSVVNDHSAPVDKRPAAPGPRPEPKSVAAAAAGAKGVYERAASGEAELPSAEPPMVAVSAPATKRKPMPAATDVAMADGELQVGPVDAEAAPAPAPYQATRPQPVQRPRQVILEWNRAPGSNGLSDASVVNYPQARDE